MARSPQLLSPVRSIQRVQDGGFWDASRLTREEADARTKRKVEAVIKRERALAYAYSHQVRCRSTRNPFSSPPWPMDI
jgi:hypothetical protein